MSENILMLFYSFNVIEAYIGFLVDELYKKYFATSTLYLYLLIFLYRLTFSLQIKTIWVAVENNTIPSIPYFVEYICKWHSKLKILSISHQKGFLSGSHDYKHTALCTLVFCQQFCMYM